ncbi:MAG: 2-amino-4-hydroxy-6-hydroxymethyldihydropteridine diphosphokinase [Bacteroidales bacterium]|nr:2-amino-4-hydroxy-6-hydroxymethyldihydropteridine diphosphokinase [Bacteroidales bacterium]
MKRVVLSLGSNMLERRKYIEDAAFWVNLNVGHILRKSSIRESEAWGFDAEPFLNQVLEVETDLSPEQVLEAAQQIERRLGRTEKSGRDTDGNPIYHSRTIDVDLLWYEGQQRHSDQLTLPHPLIPAREFVLVLLVELFGNQILEPFDCSFQTMLAALTEKKFINHEI